MILPPSLRKFALALHLALSVGWIGAVIVYLALSVAAMTTDDAATLSAAWIGMDLAGRYAIVPLAIASLVTGIVMALGTRWGLFRHYWVVFSLVLTVLATAILLLHMPDVTVLADAAREMAAASSEELGTHLYARLQDGDLLHPGLGLIVLLVIQVLNVYKPRGLTGYGQRKMREQRAESAV
jgi:Predicted integral membrane protein (DUF2269)